MQLGGYLHQDWDLDYPTVWDAVRAFHREAPLGLVEEARKQVLDLLSSVDSEEELRRILVDDLGWNYWPPADKLTFRSLLERVANEFADPPH